MTINNSTRTAGPFIGNGVTTVFPFTYKVFSRADLLVAQTVTATEVETILTLDADYTVALNSNQNVNPGGTITMLVAPPTGTTLAATSDIDYTQNLELTNQGGFYPTVINDALDRIVIQIQQLAAIVGLGSFNIGLSATLQAIINFIANSASATGATLIGYRNTLLANSILGTLFDRIYDFDAKADFGADPTGVHDSTAALNNFCNAFFDRCIARIPPGRYLYTPVIGAGTGLCFLNIIGVDRWTLIAEGVEIINSFSVTTSPNNADHLYGWNIQDCDDWEIRGLTFDGNRDTTFGSGGDGNEFYSAFCIRDCNRGKLINCSGVNCQGDGYTIGKIPFGTGCTDIQVIGGKWSRNRRNNGSISHNYGGRVTGGRYVDPGYGHGTNPQAMIDCEWEDATVGPTARNTRMILDGCDFSGVGVVGLFIPNTSGIIARNITCSMSTGAAAVTIDSTNVNYPTIDIQILGWKIRQTAGVNIVTSGGAGVAGVLVDGCSITASQPIIVNTSNGIGGNGFPVTITNNDLIGEGLFSIKVLAGRTKFHSNKCINSSSGGGDNFLALFRPLCDIQGNQWDRDNGQAAPTNGVVISNSGTIFENNSINGIAIAHPICYGENNVPAYPAARTNYRNGALLPDLVSTTLIMSPSIDTGSATPVLIYIPSNGLNKVLDAQIAVGKSGANVVATTTLSLGIVGNTTKYLNALALPVSQIGSLADIQGNLALAKFDNQVPVFGQAAPGNTAPFINVGLTMGYDTASLYTSPTLFT